MVIIGGFQAWPTVDVLKLGENKEKHELDAKEIKIDDNFDVEIEDLFLETSEVFDSSVHHLYITTYPSDGISSVNFEMVKETMDITESYLTDREDAFANIFYSSDEIDLNGTINATIEQRGQSARMAKQKSFKIKILSKDSLWFGYDTINLNKHFEDDFRIKNKLSYDLFNGLDNIVGLDTKFVELHVKDIALGMKEYESYGLYTFVEQPNKDFLDRTFNDKYGLLYKAEYFEFFNYDVIQSTNSPTFDDAAFENHLEVKGADDHKYLKEMLEDLNDYSIDIDTTIDKYFHEDNMLTWMAFNVLVSNYDSNSRNYLLYSSINKSRWYFLPWDYDKAWQYKYYNGKWERGPSNYWGLILFNRYLKKEENLKRALAKIEEVKSYLSEDRIRAYTSAYKPVVNKYLYQSPDSNFIRGTVEALNDSIDALQTLPQENYDYFMAHIEDPMPFYYASEIVTDSTVEFSWDAAYDLQNDKVTYEFILSKDYELTMLLYNEKNILETNIVIDSLPKGIYYWKVIATDSKGNWQTSFERFTDNKLIREFGVRELVIE